MLELLVTEILKKAATAVVEIGLTDPLKEANKAARRRGKRPLPVPQQLRFVHEQLPVLVKGHLADVHDFAHTVSFASMRGKHKFVDAIYVQLQLFQTPQRDLEVDEQDEMPTEAIGLLGSIDSHVVLLGQPGAGKTTLLRKACTEYFRKERFLRSSTFPILVRLRDLKRPQSDTPIFHEVSSLLPVHVWVESNEVASLSEETKQATIVQQYFTLLDKLGCALLLDGFDEIAETKTRQAVARELEQIARQFKSARLVLTSRSGEFSRHLPRTQVFEIAPLNDEQISEFGGKWLGSPELGHRFTSELRRKPYYGTSIKPLLLAHLCTLFERNGKIPEKTKVVYEKIVHLLLEEWNEENDVRRHSAYAQFSASEKHAFLSHLAFELTTELETYRFNGTALERAYKGIHANFGLPREQAREVAHEIESHTGLFIESRRRHYEFFHRSIQEFLAAEYLVKLPTTDLVSRHHGRLSAQLAIATSLSTSPSAFFAHVVFGKTMQEKGINPATFVNRLADEAPIFDDQPIAVLALYVLAGLTSGSTALDQIARLIGRNNDLKHIRLYYAFRSVHPHDLDPSNQHIRYLTRTRRPDFIDLPPTLKIDSAVLAL